MLIFHLFVLFTFHLMLMLHMQQATPASSSHALMKLSFHTSNYSVFVTAPLVSGSTWIVPLTSGHVKMHEHMLQMRSMFHINSGHQQMTVCLSSMRNANENQETASSSKPASLKSTFTPERKWSFAPNTCDLLLLRACHSLRLHDTLQVACRAFQV